MIWCLDGIGFDTLIGKVHAGALLPMNAARKPAHQDQDAFFAALGRRIKELRKERGWSLNHMHLRYGYVPSQWQRFERGKSVTIGSLLRMAEIFGVSLVTLLDSLGEFPRKAINEAVESTPEPTLAKQIMSAAASGKVKAKQKTSSK